MRFYAPLDYSGSLMAIGKRTQKLGQFCDFCTVILARSESIAKWCVCIAKYWVSQVENGFSQVVCIAKCGVSQVYVLPSQKYV